jgi:hypothetical protein
VIQSSGQNGIEKNDAVLRFEKACENLNGTLDARFDALDVKLSAKFDEILNAMQRLNEKGDRLQ